METLKEKALQQLVKPVTDQPPLFATAWLNEVVYTVFSQDDLETLPLPILEQMKQHLQSVIDQKKKDHPTSACEMKEE